LQNKISSGPEGPELGSAIELCSIASGPEGPEVGLPTLIQQ